MVVKGDGGNDDSGMDCTGYCYRSSHHCGRSSCYRSTGDGRHHNSPFAMLNILRSKQLLQKHRRRAAPQLSLRTLNILRSKQLASYAPLRSSQLASRLLHFRGGPLVTMGGQLSRCQNLRLLKPLLLE